MFYLDPKLMQTIKQDAAIPVPDDVTTERAALAPHSRLTRLALSKRRSPA